jgi:hypothetical protein
MSIHFLTYTKPWLTIVLGSSTRIKCGSHHCRCSGSSGDYARGGSFGSGVDQRGDASEGYDVRAVVIVRCPIQMMICTVTRWILEWVLQNVSEVAGVGERSESPPFGSIGPGSLMYVGVNLVNRSEDKPRDLPTIAVFVVLRLFNE